MSTQTTTSQNALYNPAAMGVYNSLQPGAGNIISQYMNSPYTSGLFNLQLQNALGQANQIGQQGVSQIAQNLAAGGFGGGNLSAYNQAALAQAGRTKSSLTAGAYQNALLGAQQLQMQAAQTAANYKPLQTGQTTTQAMSGLGTWLPQLAGSALGAFMGGGGFGQLSGLFGGGGGGNSVLNAMPTMPSNLTQLSLSMPQGYNQFIQ